MLRLTVCALVQTTCSSTSHINNAYMTCQYMLSLFIHPNCFIFTDPYHKDHPEHKAHRVVLIFVSLTLSQTQAYTAGTTNLKRNFANNSHFLPINAALKKTRKHPKHVALFATPCIVHLLQLQWMFLQLV